MSTFSVYHASTATPFRELEYASAAAIEAKLATARRLHLAGALPLSERIGILQRAAGLLAERQEDFARRIATEGGKPLTDARVETARAIDGIAIAVETLRAKGGREIPMGINPASAGRLAFTTREPIGPVVSVSAFNHPLNLIVHQVVPAVATGCPVIVKPALTTPLSCLEFVFLLHEAGLPAGWAEVALVDDAIAERLVTDPRVAFFSFIGSARVGWSLRSKLAPGTRCVLEHGGSAPVIVERDADLDKTLPGLLKGAYYHAGQVCVSTQRIFVHTEILGAFEERWVAAVEGLKVGDATRAETEVGPLIRRGEVDRVHEWVHEAVEGGGRLLCGGRKVSETTYAPTVVRDPPADCRLAREEVFGPVTTLHPFTEPDEAIARANGLEVAFQAAVLSQDLDRALYYARRLDAAAVMINDHTAFRVDWMPFGGRRTSGLGVGGIPSTMADLAPEKLFVIRSPSL